MKISIIIPVYNSEKFLGKCLDSVVAQSYADFEVLLINDGSTDTSGAICDDFASKDKRINVLHKKNGGVSVARNLGLDNAKGEWICFVDSDDYLEISYLKALIDSIKNNDSIDLAIHGLKRISRKGENIVTFGNHTIKADDYHTLFEKIEIFKYGYPFSKFYRRDLITQFDIRFPENYSFAEDLSFFLNYISYSKIIKFDNIANYNYASNENSLSRTFKNTEEYWNRYTDYKNILKYRFSSIFDDIYKTKNSYSEFKRSIGGAVFYFLQAVYKDRTFEKINRRELLERFDKEDLILIKNFIPHLNNPFSKLGFYFLSQGYNSLADHCLKIAIK